eukprot:1998034-Alexandrium_andersonii.AAC.1
MLAGALELSSAIRSSPETLESSPEARRSSPEELLGFPEALQRGSETPQWLFGGSPELCGVLSEVLPATVRSSVELNGSPLELAGAP